MSASVHMQQVAGAKLDEVNRRLSSLSAYGGNGSAAFHAVYDALKRAMSKGKKEGPHFAAARYTISQQKAESHVATKMRIQGGHGGVTGAYLIFSGSTIPLIEFENSPGVGGVNVHIKTENAGGEVAGSWYGRLPQMQIAKRVGRYRFPVKVQHGPSVPQMLANENVTTEMSDEMMDTFVKRMDHEMNRILNGFL